MANNLYVTEYPAAGVWHGTGVPVAYGPPIITQKIAFTAAAGTSVAFATNTTLIRVHNDAGSICSILISKTGTSATTGDARMNINTTEYFAVIAGQFISAIVNT